MGPLVTIAITSYNYGQYLGDAIRSALAQTYANVEVLVLDNASTDNSLEVAASFTDPRLRVVAHPENLGLQRNHNEGLRRARGEFIVLLAADDMLLPSLIDDVMAYRLTHPTVDIVYASVGIVDRDGNVTEYFDHPNFDGADSYSGRNEFANLLARDNCMYLPTTVFPKAIFEQIGWLDEDLVLTDYEFDIRMAAAGKTFGFFSKPEALIRFHGDNASGVKNLVGTGRQMREFCTILERYTQPQYHEMLAGYGPDLLAVIHRKVAEMQGPFPTEFEAARAELEPRIRTAVASITTVPAMSRRVLDGEGLVSVVMPYRGRLGPLQRALASMAAQAYPHWEAVVVADHAADPSGLIASMGLAQRVRVSTTREATGPGPARTIGLHGVRGEIVAYLDDDNRYEAGYFQALATAFADPSISATAGRVRIAVVADNGDCFSVADSDLGLLPDGRVSWVSNRLPLNAVAHRRSCISQVGAFHKDLMLLEDWEFLLRLNRVVAISRLDAAACVLCFDHQLRGHQLFGRRTSAEWTEFVSRLQDVYGGYAPRDDSERLGRDAYIRSLQPVIQAGVNSRGNPAGITAFVAALAGPIVSLGSPDLVRAN
jgi:O-antigen biosynthesis protein